MNLKSLTVFSIFHICLPRGEYSNGPQQIPEIIQRTRGIPTREFNFQTAKPATTFRPFRTTFEGAGATYEEAHTTFERGTAGGEGGRGGGFDPPLTKLPFPSGI